MVGGILSPFKVSEFQIPFKNAKRERKHTVVMNDVWIKTNVTIKGGVTIENRAVIGTRALVTKEVPPYAIVGEVPARIIRYRCDNEKIAYLQKVKWWDVPRKKLWEEIPKLDSKFLN